MLPTRKESEVDPHGENLTERGHIGQESGVKRKKTRDRDECA